MMVNFLAPVQEQIGMVEALMRRQADQHHPDLQAALNHLLSSGGKRIRPGVVLLTGHLLGADAGRQVTVAAAIELLHTATLVHDDLIDGAFLRRGIATLNSRWSPAATVLTGDFLFARAARLAASTDSIELMRLYADTLATIVNGEITLIFTGHGLASHQSYLDRIYAKTASLFELCTTASAIIAAADAQTREAVRLYGYSIGMAFQIVDDVLDFTGQQAVVGKPVASDMRQGIFTLPVLYYQESHPDDPDMAAILQSYPSGDNGKNNRPQPIEQHSPVFDTLAESIRRSGAIDQTMQEAQAYVQQGVQALARLPENTYKESLQALAYYILDRKL